MLRSHELARQLLAQPDKVVATFDSLGAPNPVKLETLHHDDYRMFDQADTIVIAIDLEARYARHEELTAQGK